MYKDKIYRHFKGNLYKIIAIAKDANTLLDLVVYQAEYGDNIIYVRPYEEFFEELDKNVYPKSKQKFRFELLKEDDSVEYEEECDENLIRFLDAETFVDKLEIINQIKDKLTDSLIDSMAASIDVTVDEDKDIENRIESLITCIKTRARFECDRLR